MPRVCRLPMVFRYVSRATGSWDYRVAGRPPQTVLRAEVCAPCARNGLAVTCLGHGDLCAQLRQVF
jgi:hypothetical protein